jgi:hypothetical protein
VAEAELRESVPVPHAVEAGVLTGANEIARRLELGIGHPDRLEQPAGVQVGELAGVAAVGLDPIARPLRDETGRDDRTGDPAFDQVAVEAEAGRAGLVTAGDPRPAPERALDRDRIVGKRLLDQQLIRPHRGEPNRRLMTIRVNLRPARGVARWDVTARKSCKSRDSVAGSQSRGEVLQAR